MLTPHLLTQRQAIADSADAVPGVLVHPTNVSSRRVASLICVHGKLLCDDVIPAEVLRLVGRNREIVGRPRWVHIDAPKDLLHEVSHYFSRVCGVMLGHVRDHHHSWIHQELQAFQILGWVPQELLCIHVLNVKLLCGPRLRPGLQIFDRTVSRSHGCHDLLRTGVQSLAHSRGKRSKPTWFHDIIREGLAVWANALPNAAKLRRRWLQQDTAQVHLPQVAHASDRSPIPIHGHIAG
mmetsp:Transcript_140854/g.392615  ORF Transcript_140854/g.392615 Transcript_140854/m.392615 type:complete len:237 (+) Transcript_140854:585-1295(+)